jgi:hypothetical protein
VNNKRLLREFIPLEINPTLIKESREQNAGKLMLSGVVQRANRKNENKRIYTREVLFRETTNYDKVIREGRAIGELDHPEVSTISLEKVSHLIREMWWEGDDVKARIEILPTPAGKIAEALIESGVTIGISSRGVGSVETNFEGYDVVQPDFQIICWDLVSEPSTSGAYLYSEGKMVEAPKLTKADRIYRALNAIVKR